MNPEAYRREYLQRMGVAAFVAATTLFVANYAAVEALMDVRETGGPEGFEKWLPPALMGSGVIAIAVSVGLLMRANTNVTIRARVPLSRSV